MHKVALALVCLACAGHGRRAHTLVEQEDDPKAQSLAMLLLAFNPQVHVHRVGATGGRHVSAHRAAVSMNLFDRFSRLVKSNVNELLSNAEDPEKVLEQAVTDMSKDLIKVRQAYAEVSASTKRIEGQIKVAEDDADKWYQRAQLALAKDDDELAKEALTRRQQQMETADTLKEQVEGQQASIKSLYESMQDLEAKMAEAKAKKDQIIARARTAKAATKVNDMLAGVGTSSSVAAFERMTEKVDQLEAQADVSKSLAKALPGASGGASMESKFKALEAGSSVDDELAKMKLMLPAPKVDSELEEMKKKMKEEKEKKEESDKM